MNHSEDYWGEDFENSVSAALIACYETKFKKNRGACPSDRMTSDTFSWIKSVGPYLPSNSRILIEPQNQPRFGDIDLINDHLPAQGVFGTALSANSELSKLLGDSAYFLTIAIRRVHTLPKGWHSQVSGTHYQAYFATAHNTYVCGERHIFTVRKDGAVFPCARLVNSFDGRRGVTISSLEHDPKGVECNRKWMIFCLNFLADRRFCWEITAQEKEAKAHIGCMKEEIKSLLYARSLPMTATGRKRPVLHLVEAHKRRMKAGIDIDITNYLRGIQTVDIDGTRFVIRPPEVIRPIVNDNSLRYYEAA